MVRNKLTIQIAKKLPAVPVKLNGCDSGADAVTPIAGWHRVRVAGTWLIYLQRNILHCAAEDAAIMLAALPLGMDFHAHAQASLQLRQVGGVLRQVQIVAVRPTGVHLLAKCGALVHCKTEN